MKKQLILACSLIVSATISAQSISKELLQKMQTENQMTPSDRAIRNALSVTDVKSLALSQDNQGEMNTYFSNSVPSKGITDQKSSGRCWLFTGLNVLRSKVINRQKLDKLEFSQIYLFFYDQ